MYAVKRSVHYRKVKLRNGGNDSQTMIISFNGSSNIVINN